MKGSNDERRLDEALLDRFLALFNEATRRVGRLFPYNHLRAAALRRLEHGAVEIAITSPDRPPTRATCIAVDGEIVRTSDAAGPVEIVWTVPRKTLEEAASTPWVFVAHPERFGVAWFTARRREPASRGDDDRARSCAVDGQRPRLAVTSG
jgi:hypothetical protein